MVLPTHCTASSIYVNRTSLVGSYKVRQLKHLGGSDQQILPNPTASVLVPD